MHHPHSNMRRLTLSAIALLAVGLAGCGDGAECSVDADCDDGVFCNGVETCGGTDCEMGTPPVVDDGVACTDDSCDEMAGAVVNTPNDALCGVGDVCYPVSGCDDPPDGCAFREAEHPSYTTPNRDVVLCGNRYDSTNIDQACGTGWDVCTLSEWMARYPSGVYPNGTLSTWGADQTVRCLGGVWEANRPEGDATWHDDVCYDAMALSNASYNPWNGGKYLHDTDGVTVLEGDGNCCNWDTSFSATTDIDDHAVYCCRE